MERERRSRERQRSRSMTKEELDRLAELQRRKEDEERKMSKISAQLQKERCDQGREEFKKSKEKARAEETEKKNIMRLKEVERKEHEKAEERAKREENKREGKTRQLAKKDIVSELRKVRNDVSASVLEAFDEEEKEDNIVQPLISDAQLDLLPMDSDGQDLQSLTTTATTPTTTNSNWKCKTLQEVITNDLQQLPRMDTFFSNTTHATWDDFFTVMNFLNIFKTTLGLEGQLTFDRLVASFGICSAEFVEAIHHASDQAANCDVQEQQSGDAMEIDNEADETLPRTTTTRKQQQQQEHNEKLPTDSCQAELDRIQLHLLRLLVPSVHSLLDLDSKEIEVGPRRDKRLGAVKLPLNPLTFAELVRMVLLQFVMTDIGRTREEMQAAIRGSKASNFRIAKNINRNIRYKWYIRNKLPVVVSAVDGIADVDMSLLQNGEDWNVLCRILDSVRVQQQQLQWVVPSIQQDREMNVKRLHQRPSENIFSNEQELLDELTKLTDGLSFPEVYRRCGKVLLRILKFSTAQQFEWEIDQDAHPEYHETITRPLMFSHVAYNLLNRVYEDFEGVEEMEDKHTSLNAQTELTVVREFYADMKQVVVNCMTYSTEATTIVSSAQKILLSIVRHVDRWVSSPKRLPLECCDDKYCLMTGEKIANKGPALKCGKCSGTFHLDVVEDLFSGRSALPVEYESYGPFFIAPTDELVNQATEEWHCPFCLQEDFVSMQSYIEKHSLESLLSRSFYIDDWGPSATLPWMFNPIHSNILERFARKESHFLPVVNALSIVSRCHEQDSEVSGWTFAEHVTVMQALFVVFQSTEQGLKVIQKLHDDGERLTKYSSRTHFREAEFLTFVKEISGEEGVLFCRKLLDGFDFGSDGVAIDYSQEFVEGCCIVCNGSTITNDQDDDENNNAESGEELQEKAILCDGCNCEAHLRCLGLQSVPYSSWFCTQCSLRQSLREKKQDGSHLLEILDNRRDKENEEELVWRCVERKIQGLNPFADYSGQVKAYRLIDLIEILSFICCICVLFCDLVLRILWTARIGTVFTHGVWSIPR
jgi:hypothetical protein